MEPSKVIQSLAARLRKDPGTPVPNATDSFWQDPPLAFANQQSARLPEDSDVVLIGSGITGISIAQHLLRLDPSLRIVMLEARTAISGATGRNGGHIKAVPFTDYHDLKAELGRESAMKIIKFRLAHLDAMVREAELLGKAGEVGLVRRVTAYCGIYDKDTWEISKKNLEAWLEDFPEEQENWTAHEGEAELKKMGLANASGCICGPAGAAWPYRFLGVILSNLMEGGHLSLEANTVATGIERSKASKYPYQVKTSRGNISTKHVVHCTNGYAAHLLPALTGKLWPLRGQMTVTSVPKEFPRVGATRSWSTIWARGFDYISQSPGDDGCLYLGGGALQEGPEKDEDIGSTDDSVQSPPCLRHLEKVPAKAFQHGEGSKIENKWTGIMGFTGDHLPMVDRVKTDLSGREECNPTAGGEWIAAGFNGYGMVHCWLTGKALASMMTGREAEILDWFPRNEFSCSKQRLSHMSPETALERFVGQPPQLDSSQRPKL